MQDVLQDFLVWLMQFLAVAAGLLAAARAWTVYRNKQRQFSDSKNSKLSKPHENSLPWTSDSVLARLMRVVVVLAVAVIGGCFLFISRVSSWIPWATWGGAIVLTWGLSTFWVVWSSRRRMELGELRRFANLLELAALPHSGSEKPPSEILWFLSERDCKRLPETLQPKFAPSETKIDPAVLRSLADAVHQEVAHQALDQARRVSQWGKYPLLIGVVPLLCFLLVAPLTEWTLDRITRVSPTVDFSQSREKSKQRPLKSQAPDERDH